MAKATTFWHISPGCERRNGGGWRDQHIVTLEQLVHEGAEFGAKHLSSHQGSSAVLPAFRRGQQEAGIVYFGGNFAR